MGQGRKGRSREDPGFRAQTSHILSPAMLGPWPFLKGEQFSCTGLGSSLKPVSRYKRGLQDISAALVSIEKPSLTGTSAQGVQMHPSRQAQSSSKQKVNSAPPSSAISEKREGEHPQRTAESGNVLPKNIKCSGHKERVRGRTQPCRDILEVGSSRTPCPDQDTVPGSPLLSATLPTPSIQAQVYLHSPTQPHPTGPQGRGDQETGSNIAL